MVSPRHDGWKVRKDSWMDQMEDLEHGLWSDEHAQDLLMFLEAVEAESFLEALLRLEQADPTEESMCLSQLEAWGQRARMAGEIENPKDQAETLRRVLVDDMDLQGDNEDYYHPQNSYLSQVLLRRRGLPISLAVVWMEVGQRAGYLVDGVGMPGHFLVRVGGRDGVYVDVFNGGDILSREECRELFLKLSKGQRTWQDHFLDVVSQHTILERILRNLSYAYVKQGDVVAFYRSSRFLWSLLPEDPTPLLACVQIAERFGDVEQSIEDCELLLQRFPDTKEAQLAASHLASLHHQKRSAN